MGRPSTPYYDGSDLLLLHLASHHDAASDNGGSHTSPPSEHSSLSSYTRLQSVVESLKSQHNLLVQSLVHIPLVDTPAPTSGRPLSSTPESPVEAFSHNSRRTSVASGTSIWYDAPEPDGALEFFLEDTTHSSSASRLVDDAEHSQDADEADEDEGEGDDTDEEGSSAADEREVEATSSPQRAQPQTPTTLATKEVQPVVRRTQLPSGPVADEGSLFSVLKKNVGKVCHLTKYHPQNDL